MKFFQADSKIKVLSVIYFMVAQSSMMARATSDSFLLKYFQAESIPLMIMGAASLSIVLALLSTYLCERFQAYGAMRIATAGIVITLIALVPVVFLLGAKGETKPIYVFAYMLCETIVILPMVLFWGMAMGVLNPTESKRWMGLIGAAGTLGCILAGFTISFVSKQEYVNELSLGMNAAVLLVVSIILMVRAKLFTLPDDDDPPTDQATYSIFKKIGVLISSKQSMLMTWLVVFSAIVLSLIDINFKFEVRKDFSEDLYDFFGQFYTYTSCVQLLLQLFIVRAILTRGGVMAAISILPILLLLVSVGALLLHSREAVYVGKFMTQVVFFTIEYVGLQMLFLSVRKKLRGQMNSAVDGLTRPATIATISLLITYTLPFWQGGSETDTIYRLNLIIISLCVCWLFVALFNYRFYLSALLAMVGGRISRQTTKSVPSMDKIRFSNMIDELASATEDGLKLVTNSIAECSPKQLANLDTAIQGLEKGEFRNQLEQTFYSYLFQSGIMPRKKLSFKKRADSLIEEITELNLFISALSKPYEDQNLCHSLERIKRDKLSNLACLLTVFNSSINYSKLFEHISANHADLKSQSLEVLKGAIGPKRMDAVMHALEGNSTDSFSNLEEIRHKLANHSNPEISVLVPEAQLSQPAAT
ncbi:MAG: Npt1/Npt2 family nucleotide transporter [Opitutae bacterium]